MATLASVLKVQIGQPVPVRLSAFECMIPSIQSD